MSKTSRRNILVGLAGAGAAVPVLVACGSGSSPETSNGAPSSGGAGSGEPGSVNPGGIPSSDIPVGGGKIFEDDGFVITQPSEGEFKAFSVICTHSGCPVTKVEDGTIDCTCHGSKYSIEDGSVQDGPAPAPLDEKSVTVTGTNLTVS